MPDFRLTRDQQDALVYFVKGRSLLDAGAQDLRGATLLLELGAKDVLAVDRNPMPKPRSDRITTWEGHFHDLKETRPVLFASWVVNWAVGLERFIEEAEMVISVSKNTDGTTCGYKGMWARLRLRGILLHMPERANTLTVYGPHLVERGPTGEEYAALYPDEMRMFSFDEAEELATIKSVSWGT